MTNTNTTPCLPAAPRRGKSSILHFASCTLHSAFRTLHSAFLIVAMAAMTAAAANMTEAITKITSTGTATYSEGDTITFHVYSKYKITSVSGSPKLVLKNFQNAATVDAQYKRYVDDGPTRSIMEFEYTVQPGDSSTGVGIDSIAINGATIKCNDDEDQIVSAPLPSADKILAGETITIVRFTPKIVSLETYDPSESAKTFTEGEEIIIKATLNGAIDADTFQTAANLPYLTLGVQNPGTAAGDKRAYLYSDMDEGGYGNNDAGVSYLIFIYTVKSGDYSGGLNAKTFAKSGATINVNGTPLTSTMPSDSTISNVKIDALAFSASDYSISGKAGETATLTLYRGEAASQQQKFSISNSTPSAVTWTPTAPAIAKNKDSVELTLTFVEEGSHTLFIHPDGYDTDAGDIEIALEIAEADRPSVLFISGDDTLFEGNEYSFGITLSEKPADNVTVTIESNQPDCLSITGGNTLTFYANQPPDTKYVYVKALDDTSQVELTATPTGQTFQPATKLLTINNVAPKIVAPVPTPEDAEKYEHITEGFPYSLGVIIDDVDADEDNMVITIDWNDGSSPTTITETFNASASHTYEQAKDPYYITIRARDGKMSAEQVIVWVAVTDPTRIVINEYKARIPTDAGQNAYKGLQGLGRGTIDDNLDLTDRQMITRAIDWVLKYNDAVSTATLIASPSNFLFNGMNSYGESGEWGFDSFFHVWLGEEDTFLSRWCFVPLSAPVTAGIRLRDGDESVDCQVGGVFSREHYPEDGCPDIDFDELPDGWETLVWPVNGTDTEGGAYPFESVAAPYGRNDNPDGDFLPACVTGIDAETGDFTTDGCDFSPSGLAFINVYEVRGTHRGLNMNLASTPIIGTTNYTEYTVVEVTVGSGNDPADENNWLSASTNVVRVLPDALSASGQNEWILTATEDDAETHIAWVSSEDITAPLYAAEPVEPQDEPHCGSYDKNGVFTDNGQANKFFPWFGTDPTNPDTDGDKLTDGYEYFFWRSATFSTNVFAEIYNPTKVVTGIQVTNNNLIAAAFNPCVATDHLEADFDGDGLTDFEEFLLGTNPVHWDTDRDGMNDGWEVLWGLNPKDKKDANENPDGDFMANDGNNLYHWRVYEHYGFDPRTAWSATYLERNRLLALPTPNTAPFSNYHEHYLGRWSIDNIPYIDSVEPMSTDFMTQPVPNGTPRFYDPSWKGNKRKVPDHAVNPSGGDTGTEAAAGTETADGGAASGGGATGTAAEGGYTVPIGSAAYIVEPVEITTHGCDSDNDGMPDGWELYIYKGDGSGGDLWPTGKGADIDAGLDYDGDLLSNREECRSVELCDYYASVHTNGNFAFSGNWFNKWWPCDPFNSDTDGDHLPDGYEGDATFSYQDAFATGGTNGAATAEAFVAARFGGTTMLRGHVPGGRLNPCCIDTDMDYIPDHWEYLYAGRYRDTAWEGGFCNEPGTETGLMLQNGQAFIVLNGAGMDGTYFDSRSGYDECSRTEDRNFDYDGDGLENYQEYWINGVYHFQYFGNHPWVAGGDYGDYDPNDFFDGPFPSLNDHAVSFEKWGDGDSLNPITKSVHPLFMSWDWSTYANDWQNAGGENPGSDPHVMTAPSLFHYMPSEIRPLPLGAYLYASTDPRLADSDGDGMDDYYEMFHGLNPILSDVVDYCQYGANHPAGETYDFRKFPWMAGMPNADPDGDDIPNWEEALSPSQPAPANHNTDPSPMWMTDMSYDHSFVNLYYNWGTAANFWTTENEQYPEYEYFPFPDNMFPGMMDPRPHYVFDFECNEGFDTDNDNLSDPYEINGSAGGVTDSQNPDRPIGRKALYLDGNAAARTRSLCAFGPNAFRSFTLEVWVMPEEPASGKMQVVLERPVSWNESNTSPTYENIRRNFRLGLLGDGRPFVEFDNGGKNLITERALADAGTVLEAGKWCHLAATMDGFAGKLSLYMNGRRIAVKSTTQIPYTGFTTTALNAVGSDEYHQPRWSPVVIGASDANPVGKVDGSWEFYNGAIFDVAGGQPQLGDFFKGWVDEVRIWDGARPGGEDVGDQRVAIWRWPTIADDYENLKRYGMDDVRAARNDVIKYLNRIVDYRKRTLDSGNAAATAALTGSNPNNSADTNTVISTDTTWFLDGRGLTFDEFIQEAVTYILMTGGEDSMCRIPPSLACVYNFDTLPDPDYEPKQPAKFASLNGRPMDYNGVPWLRGATDRTTVYTSAEAPYLFPQYIQNLVSWQPLGHLVAAGTDAEYNEIIGDQANMPLFAYQPDSVVNSKYWTRYTKGGQNLADLEAYANWGTDTVNSFPNSANPYGYRYETGIIVNEENHPLTTALEAYDPSYAALFNDLVPLRNARADMSVQLWDDPTGDKLGVNKDYDGDGLPDWWELANGMDPYNSDQNGNGIRDDVDDFDGDGLCNWYEYLAGKLNPFLPDSDSNGVSDFNSSSPDSELPLSYGWLYADSDYVLDSYELQWDENFASPYRYDEHEDRDLDGWDNWSEGLVGTVLAYNFYNENVGSNSTNGAESSIADKAANFPLPDLKVTLDYHGTAIQGAKLVIHAYSHEDMNGWPDAVFVKDFSSDTLGTWPMTVTVGPGELAYGHIRQGKNWFFAWMDGSGSSSSGGFGGLPTWSANEPAAIADNQLDGIGIGFDLNEVTFHFTDKAESFARFSWEGAMPAGDNVHVAIFSGGNPVFDRVIKWPRTWLHEGDIISWNQEHSGYSRKNFGLGAQESSLSANNDVVRSFVTVLTPQRDYEAEQWSTAPFCEISNWVHTATALAKPVLYGPIGYEIVAAARPEFKFRLDPEFTEFDFRLITRIDESGEWTDANRKTLYDERVLAPGRFRNDVTHERDLVIFKSPLAVGDTWTNGVTFEAGKTYRWVVKAFSPGVKGGISSETQNFVTASSSTIGDNLYVPGGKGVIDVKVLYPSGMAYAFEKQPFIRVQAFRSKSFNGDPDASVVQRVSGASMGDFTPVTVRLYGLELGVNYYLRAYIELGGDPLARDKWESWGYYRNDIDVENRFMPVAVQSLGSDNVRNPYEITIQDCDTDNDLLPDAWEWANIGDLSLGVEQARFNVGRTSAYATSPIQILAAAPQAFHDQDGDGISDYDEIYTGSNPALADSDGDGIADGLERTLGSAFDATTPQVLKITSVSFDAGGNPVLDWTWDGTASPAKGRALLKAGRQVAYIVQGKVALTDPEWKTVRTVYTDEIDGEAVVTEEGAPPDVDVKALRFFRVKVGAE